MRKAVPLLAAGVLLQAGGCNTNEVLVQWLNAVVASWVQSLVFGSFNLI